MKLVSKEPEEGNFIVVWKCNGGIWASEVSKKKNGESKVYNSYYDQWEIKPTHPKDVEVLCYVID